MRRYEIKYVYPSVYLDRLEKEVLCLPYCFREIYYERQINNIYLDTPDFTDYRNAVNGVSTRSKTRIRWYGTLWQEIAHPTLEIKYKIGMVGGKKLFPLPPLSFDGSFVYERYFRNMAEVSSVCHDVALALLAEKMPAVVNTYQRRYFSTPDGLCRITLDREMRFYSPDMVCMGDGCGIPNSHIVLEVKFEKEQLIDVAQLLQNVGYHIGKNSKYVNGINAIYHGESTSQRM